MSARLRSFRPSIFVAVTLAAALLFAAQASLDAQARVNRSYARASVHRSNTAAHVTRRVDVDVHENNHYDRWGHPVASAAAFTAAAVAVGTVVASLPPHCSTTVVGTLTYHNCGGVYYQPVYQTTTVQYVIVNHP